MKNIIPGFRIIMALMLAGLGNVLSSHWAGAQVPPYISYKGKMSVNGTNFTGLGLFKFALVSKETTRQATARANMDALWRVSSITVTRGGSGYLTTPNVTIAAPPLSPPGYRQAIARAEILPDTSVGSIIVVDGGSYPIGARPGVIIDPPLSNLRTYWSFSGDSVDGSEPTGGEYVWVENGLFSVMLGPIPSAIFANPDVHLRIWFNDGVQGFSRLEPDQQFGSVGYAMIADTAVAMHSLGSAGGTLQNAVDVDAAGNVSIGGSVEYASPLADQVNEGTTDGAINALGASQSFTAGASGNLAAIRLWVQSAAPVPGVVVVYIFEGSRQIGGAGAVVSPGWNGPLAFNIQLPGPGIIAGKQYRWLCPQSSAALLRYHLGDPYPGGQAGHDPAVDFWFTTYVSNPIAYEPASGLNVNAQGGVGIGKVNTSSYALDVLGDAFFRGSIRVTNGMWVQGNLRVQDPVSGSTVVELGTGLDFAEGFNVGAAGTVASGSVLSIDPQHPGKLQLCTTPYDRKVAGIVAGAKNLGSGVRLGSGQYDYDVALAGRVYRNVDATDAAVETGDLLTTSSKPGYAMKVRNPGKAQGAVLGKAMEPLARGRTGQILVLVTLQ